MFPASERATLRTTTQRTKMKKMTIWIDISKSNTSWQRWVRKARIHRRKWKEESNPSWRKKGDLCDVFMLYNRPTFRAQWNCPRLCRTLGCMTNSYLSQSQSGLYTKMNGSISKKRRRTNHLMPHNCIANSYLYPVKTYWQLTLTQTKNSVGLNQLNTRMRHPFAS